MKQYYFHQICGVCPEQYDVYESKKDVNVKEPLAYVRLRWGFLYCAVPFGGETVFEHEFENDEYKGCFDTQEETDLYLKLINEAIYNHLNNTVNGKETTT